MRKKALALAAATLMMAGCTSTDGDLRSLVGLGSPRTPTEDAAYVTAAATADAYLLQAAQVGLTHAQRPEVRAFAQKLIREHTQSSQRLARAVEEADLTAPGPVLQPAQLQMLAALNAASGSAFDTLFLSEQIGLQRDISTLHRNYALIGKLPDLRDYAAIEDPIDYEHMMLARHLS